MRILTFTTLYPSVARSHHGIFVEDRLRHLVGTGEVTSRVVAPVPWVPFGQAMFAPYRELAGTPREDERFGIPVRYPRYPVIPKVGMTASPFLLYAATAGLLRRIVAGGYDFELIDAHYCYPDGVAAVMAGRRLNKPVVITARGTDVNLIPAYRLPRRMILWAAAHAAALITVCQALKDRLVELGVPERRVTVLRNGVDLDMFRPVDRVAARARLGLTGTSLLSVGHLILRKGHDIVIRALQMLPGPRLLIVGEGPEESALRQLASGLGLEERVVFVGRVPHERLLEYYNAADALVLASSREGWANVLLEAMACGTPVVATDVWGTPEVVAAREAGRLVHGRSPEAVAEAIAALLARPPDRGATRAYAERFSWDATTQGQIELFRRVVKRGS